MPEWTAPFGVPKLTDAEFRAKQKAYVAKYGYRYSIPGFDDVIHLQFEKPMTDQEVKDWKAKRWSSFSPDRLIEIQYMKRKRWEKYLDILGSPTPDVFNNRASIMTALDNAQDAMSVVAALGIVASKFLPKYLSRLLTGPLGWMLAGADVLNQSMRYLAPEMRLLALKREYVKLTETNPFLRKARLKGIDRLMRNGLGVGFTLEALQVTKDVFGKGISLGPIMGLPFAIISGAARAAMGQPVTVRYPIPNIPIWKRRILRAFMSDPIVMGVKGILSTIDKHKYLISGNLRAQSADIHGSIWNPMEKCDNVGNIEVEAPIPWNVLTQEVIQEIDAAGINKIGWPSTGKRWSTINEISMSTHETITNRFVRYCKNNNRNFEGYIGAMNAHESAFYTLEYLGGQSQVQYEYIAAEKICHSLYNLDYRFPQDLTFAQQARFTSYLEEHENLGTCPPTYDAMNFAKNICGFEFKKGPLPWDEASPYMQSIMTEI